MAFYKDGSEIKAGNPIEFYIGIDIFTDSGITQESVWVFSIFQTQIVVTEILVRNFSSKIPIPFGK